MRTAIRALSVVVWVLGCAGGDDAGGSGSGDGGSAATMDDFLDTPPGENAAELVNPSDDANAIVGDPVLGSQSGLVLPRWVQAQSQFADGSTSICQVHAALVSRYGTPGVGSVVPGAADPTQMPADDILGAARGSSPDVGVVEVS